jgi:hypothetical protein
MLSLSKHENDLVNRPPLLENRKSEINNSPASFLGPAIGGMAVFHQPPE